MNMDVEGFRGGSGTKRNDLEGCKGLGSEGDDSGAESDSSGMKHNVFGASDG